MLGSEIVAVVARLDEIGMTAKHGRRRRRAIQLIVAVLLAFGALAVPASAVLPGEEPGGWQWSWGHNYLSDTYKVAVSGWNYWTLQYLHKHNGGWLDLGFAHLDDTICYSPVVGSPWEIYQTPGDLHCGGYLRSFVLWESGSRSYLYTGAN
jgi:hypothetical protein